MPSAKHRKRVLRRSGLLRKKSFKKRSPQKSRSSRKKSPLRYRAESQPATADDEFPPATPDDEISKAMLNMDIGVTETEKARRAGQQVAAKPNHVKITMWDRKNWIEITVHKYSGISNDNYKDIDEQTVGLRDTAGFVTSLVNRTEHKVTFRIYYDTIETRPNFVNVALMIQERFHGWEYSHNYNNSEYYKFDSIKPSHRESPVSGTRDPRGARDGVRGISEAVKELDFSDE